MNSINSDPASGAECSGQAPEETQNYHLKDGERWYVVQSLSRREATAEHHLRRQGFRAFLPRFQKKVRHARQIKTILAPVFPGYLFVALDIEKDRWRSINGTFGVARIITAYEQPAVVPKGVVERLVASVDDKGLVIFDDGLRLGNRVRILEGPFADTFGVLERLDDRGRIKILLEIMGGKVPILIDRNAVTSL